MTEELPMVQRLPEFNEVEIRREVKRYKALGDKTRLKMFRVLENGVGRERRNQDVAGFCGFCHL